jgi:hypothetical protein
MKPWNNRRARVLVISIVVVAVTASSAAYAISRDDGTTPGVAGFRPAASSSELRAQLIARLAEAGRPDLAPTLSSAFEVARQQVDGSEWLMASYTNAAGQRCIMEAVPKEGRGIGCQDLASVFRDEPLFVTWGTRQEPGGSLTEWDVSWITGLTRSPVRSARVIFTDCSSAELGLQADGSFLAVFGASVMHSGAWPYVVRGFDGNSRLVAEREVRLESKNARGTMIEGPEPAATCTG